MVIDNIGGKHHWPRARDRALEKW